MDDVGDACDNCPGDSNSDQADNDGDCIGNVCDPSPDTYDPVQADADVDMIGDSCDNCPSTSNPEAGRHLPPNQAMESANAPVTVKVTSTVMVTVMGPTRQRSS